MLQPHPPIITTKTIPDHARADTTPGSFSLIVGCMFSGKTTELLQTLASCIDRKTVAFKNQLDHRYEGNFVVTHGGKAHPAITVQGAGEIQSFVSDEIKLVAIDEAHFFSNSIVGIIRGLSAHGHDVVVTALDYDSWGRPFPVVEELLKITDSISRKTATCGRCNQVATRTQRLTPIVDGDMVGGSESYEPRCTHCWSAPPQNPPAQCPSR